LYREVPGKKISAMLVGNPHIRLEPYKDIAEAERILASYFTPFQN
jgi:hypothetical protein